MRLRTFHKKVALFFSPFFLLTSFTGIALLFRKDEMYSKETKDFFIGLHNWEYGMKYIGIILALGLITVTISGLMIYFKKR